MWPQTDPNFDTVDTPDVGESSVNREAFIDKTKYIMHIVLQCQFQWNYYIELQHVMEYIEWLLHKLYLNTCKQNRLPHHQRKNRNWKLSSSQIHFTQANTNTSFRPELLRLTHSDSNSSSFTRSVLQRSWTLWRSGWERSSARCLTSEYRGRGSQSLWWGAGVINIELSFVSLCWNVNVKPPSLRPFLLFFFTFYSFDMFFQHHHHHQPTKLELN